MKKIISVMICFVLMLSGYGCAKDEKEPMGTKSEPTVSTTEQTIGETYANDAWTGAATAIPEDFGMENSLDDPEFAEVFDNTHTAPLDKLVAFCLIADGLSEGATDELYRRFINEPNTVLTFLELLGDETYPLTGLGEVSIAEWTCKNIALAAAAWHGDTTEFADTTAQYQGIYPDGRISQLLDIMEQEHAAAVVGNPS